MQWALRKRGLPEILVKVVISLYEGSKIKFEVGSEFLEEFYVALGVHQRSVLSPLLFAIGMGVVMENAKVGLIKEILYADDWVLMSQTMEGLRKRFLKWISALEGKGLKMNLEKTKVIVCVLESEVMWSRIDPCGICGKRVTVNSVLSTKCDQWIHGRCSKLKKVTNSKCNRR